MNPILVFALGAPAVLFAVHAAADWLNLRHAARGGVPDEFRAEFPEEKARRALDYLRAQTVFGLVESGVGLVAGAAFLLLGGFGAVDRWARGFGLGEMGTGLLFVGGLAMLGAALSWPFSLWRTFRIEEEFGFNRTTFRTWITDRIKGMVLGALIGGAFFSALVWFFLRAGDSAWWMAWLFLVAAQLALMVVAPVWLLPLFNKFTALPAGDLREAIESYAKKEGFRIGGIYTMDGSRRSSKANAFFTGLGRTRRIAIFDTLMEKASPREIVAVLAHEVGHAKRWHVPKMAAVSLLSSLALLQAADLLLGNPMLYDAFQVETPGVYAGLVILGVLYGPVQEILGVFVSALSRAHEYEADAFAKKTTGDGEALASALKKLATENLTNLSPHPWKVALEYSHPPVVERIRALRGP